MNIELHTQYHKRILKEEYLMSARLADYIWETYHPKSITDYGCSTGLYLLPFKQHNVNLLGLELDEVAIENKVFPNVVQCDLTKNICITPSEMAFCFEVAEHIEESDSDSLLDNIDYNTTKYIIWSAAQPGQGEGEGSIGIGHVNCQSKMYWLKKWQLRNWHYCSEDTLKLINYIKSGYFLGWFAENVMVLRKLT